MGNYDDLDRATLIRLLQRRDAERQLGLVWERDEIEADNALNDDYVALELDPALSHGGAPWDNLIVEGDNFDALRALRASHKGAIRCIYIDPPYNTGNRDFVYNDRFVDKTHRFRHSLWLEFMYRRLTLARELLADDGVIFVSIDDNELFRLGMLMDRVFGESNWIQTLIWKKSYGGGAKTKHVVGLHEYVLCFAKQKDLIERIELPPDPKVLKYYKLRDEKFETRGPYRLQPLATKSMDTRENLRYSIPYNGEEVWPAKQWQWSRERTMAALAADELVFTKKGDEWTVNYKQYLRDGDGAERGSKPYSIIEGPFTQEGTSEIRDILGDGKTFSFPKPGGLLAHLISYLPSDTLVLDFFAGSGTTAHAVAKLNAEDGGSRKFILVSSTEATEDQPDKNLCRDVCAQRVRKVLGGYTNAKGEAVAGLGGGFAYLRARRVPRHRLTQKLDHPEIWNALQLLHACPLSAWTGEGFAVEGQDEAVAFAYLANAYPASVARLHAWLATRGERPAVIYSWSPERYRTVGSPHDWRPIPQHLRERFGR
nr:site-specific DNA-methyltransferase [Luteimonas weifangensis]